MQRAFQIHAAFHEAMDDYVSSCTKTIKLYSEKLTLWAAKFSAYLHVRDLVSGKSAALILIPANNIKLDSIYAMIFNKQSSVDTCTW